MKKDFRIALIATEYTPSSHADVIVSRWLEPRPHDASYGWVPGRTRIASFFVAQQPAGRDLSVDLAARHGIPLFDTIEKALTLGGDSLAVDAVLLIAEHGDYPNNSRGQKLYPRKEFFGEVMRVFRASGRNVPLFFDKHLSWNPAWIEEMYAEIRAKAVPFFGGSSISFQPMEPPVMPGPSSRIREAVAIYFNALEDYLFHSLELVQSLVENRAGGECGIREITAWRGNQVWDAIDRGAISATLVDAAARVAPGEAFQAWKEFQAGRGHPIYAFQLTYADGLKATHLMQRDLIKKWTVALSVEGEPDPLAGCVQTAGAELFFPHFARFARQIEEFFLSGKSPIPLERLYLTSMGTALCMEALERPGVSLPCPNLVVGDHRAGVGGNVAGIT